MTRANTRLSGHALIGEGAAHDANGNPVSWYGDWGNRGHGKCSCGAISPELPSRRARQRWHREVHKAEILAAALDATISYE